MVVVRGGSVTWVDSWLCQKKLPCLPPAKAIPAQLWIHPSHTLAMESELWPTPSLPPPKLMISSCHAGGERNPISPPETTELTTSLQPALLKSSPLSPFSALPRQADKEPLCREPCPAQQLSQAGRGTGGWGGSWGVSSCRARCYSDTEHNKSALAHTSQPHSRRSPAHFSMENTKGLANRKKKPGRYSGNPFPATLGWPGLLPRLASGSQLVTEAFCYDHEFGQLETELAFPVRHCRERERTAQDQQMKKQE